jgi:hypothetical protein
MGDVTFHADVASILQQKCQSCHRSGGVAPFALEEYHQVYARRARVFDAIKSGYMPPWFADPDIGVWANDRSLSEGERRTLLAWVEQGAPQGNPADAPPPTSWSEGWNIGEPDVVIRIPHTITVPATGVMPYRYVYAATDFPEDRWVQGFEIRPTAPDVVHHALVFLEEPDYPGQVYHSTVVRPGFQIGREGWFATYVPGYQGVVYPEGMAKLLPRGATLKFQLHYTPSGTETEDRTEIGFIFADKPPDYRVETGAVISMDFAIPPGASSHRVRAEKRFDEPVMLLGFAPHMHLRGKAFRYELVYSFFRKETLLDIPRWDFNWQDEYILETPVEVPAGATLRATGWFDNSADNPLNPDPTQTVRFGEQTYEEMMNGYFHYLIRNPDVGPEVASRP